MDKRRKRFMAKEKVRVLRRHLVEKVPVSDVCDELGVQPTQFYRWQQQFFENGSVAFKKEDRNIEATKPRSSKREQAERSEAKHGEWILNLTYGQPSYSDLVDLHPKMSEQDIDMCLECLSCGCLHVRKRVASILASLNGIPCHVTARYLHLSRSTVYYHSKEFERKGCSTYLRPWHQSTENVRTKSI